VTGLEHQLREKTRSQFTERQGEGWGTRRGRHREQDAVWGNLLKSHSSFG
jgi:hypothetical protein